MAHTLSAKKRIRQNTARRALNRWRKRRIHDAVRDFEEKLHGKDVGAAEQAFVRVSSLYDKVAGKRTIHRNKAARRKSRLAKRLNAFKSAGA
ncbi:MAG: 30S ribosomal protein S20 [Planctomycetes bacterium]|nr:30S ribosomal protein S20 [Planctomycetota bacterium]NOG55218.1 30S ribosomal protein S20 [Planctomycetota bacterium]